jgi:mannose-6-phosphate isomerase-like protein (cupin superfamily)
MRRLDSGIRDSKTPTWGWTEEDPRMNATGLETDFSVKTFEEMESVAGGMFVKARASLGGSAFGVQVLNLPPNSGDMYPEHDHGSDGQEEIYLLLDGSGHIALPGGPVELSREKMIRVGPKTRRRLRSGADGARVLAVGGIVGQAYAPSAGTELGATPEFKPDASSDLIPDGPRPQLDC